MVKREKSDKAEKSIRKLATIGHQLWFLPTIIVAAAINNPWNGDNNRHQDSDENYYTKKSHNEVVEQPQSTEIAPESEWKKFGAYMSLLYENSSEEHKGKFQSYERLWNLKHRFEEYQREYNRQASPFQECIPLRELWTMSVNASDNARKQKERSAGEEKTKEELEHAVDPKTLLTDEQYAHLFFFYYLVNSPTFKILAEDSLPTDPIVCMSNDHNFSDYSDNKGFYNKRLNVLAYELKDTKNHFDMSVAYQLAMSNFVELSQTIAEEIAHLHQHKGNNAVSVLQDKARNYDRKLVDHFVEGQAKFTRAVVLAEMAVLDEGYKAVIDYEYTNYPVARSLYNISQSSGVPVSKINTDLLIPLYEEVLWDQDFIRTYHSGDLNYMNAHRGCNFTPIEVTDYIKTFGEIPGIESNLLEQEYSQQGVDYIVEKFPNGSGLKAWFKVAINAKASYQWSPELDADPDKTDYSFGSHTCFYPGT